MIFTGFRLILVYIYFASVGFIILCFALGLLVKYSNFQFADNGEVFDQMCIFGIPIAILLTLTRLPSSGSSKDRMMAQSVITIISAFVVFIILTLNFSLNLCGESTREVLFESNINGNDQIVVREFGCGAVDSGRPSLKVCELTSYPFGLIYVTRVDTNSIDLRRWSRIK